MQAPVESGAAITELMRQSADRAGRLLFGATGVRFPLDVAAVSCYADAG